MLGATTTATAPVVQEPAAPGTAARDRTAIVRPVPGRHNAPVRSSPAYDADKLTELPEGTPVRVLSESDDRVWRRIRYPFPDGTHEGWIHHDVLGAGADAAAASPADARAELCSTVDRVTNCTADLFVQLLTVSPSVPATFDYPDVQTTVKDHHDLAGMRVVEAMRNGKRIAAAVALNRCQADKLAILAQETLRTGPVVRCEPIQVTREVFRVR